MRLPRPLVLTDPFDNLGKVHALRQGSRRRDVVDRVRVRVSVNSGGSNSSTRGAHFGHALTLAGGYDDQRYLLTAFAGVSQRPFTGSTMTLYAMVPTAHRLALASQ